MKAPLKLNTPDRIIAVVAEPASGPGWANTPLWIIVQDGNGKLRRECLQPDEQSDGLRVLYATAAAVHGALVREVEALAAVHGPRVSMRARKVKALEWKRAPIRRRR